MWSADSIPPITLHFRKENGIASDNSVAYNFAYKQQIDNKYTIDAFKSSIISYIYLLYDFF